MAYDYSKYMKNYREQNLTVVTVVFNKTKDKDILDNLDPKNKSGKIKELIRKGLESERSGKN
jgi:hypothetical protein